MKQTKKGKKEEGLLFLDESDFDDRGYGEEVWDAEEPLSEEEKALRKKKRKKKALYIGGGIVGVLLAVYLGLAAFFHSHYYFFTTINGTSVSGKSVSQVEAFMKNEVAGYELQFVKQDDSAETVKGSDIDLSYQKSDELNKILKSQNSFLWPKALFAHEKVEAAVGVAYDKDKLRQQIDALQLMNAENQTVSVSAKPKYNGEAFVIEPEVVGTQIDTEVFYAKAEEYVDGFQDSLDLTKEGCYIKPKFTQESQEVIAAKDKMNSYLNTKITYNLNPKTEVVDKTQISQWLTVDENMNIAFNTELLNQFIQNLASKYNTVGKTRTFVTGSGNTVQVEGGDYGWRLDQKGEYSQLTADIQTGTEVNREPIWKRRGATHADTNDYGNTYAEVDLTKQYFWFFKDGKVVLQSDIVTGKPSIGASTPQGSYDLTYKTRNAVLRGPKLPNGEYQWESPVDFWMPFNGDIGFHDASWQPRYGGDWYLTHGSQGCINMPYEAAKQLYSLIDESIPIICHY